MSSCDSSSLSSYSAILKLLKIRFSFVKFLDSWTFRPQVLRDRYFQSVSSQEPYNKPPGLESGQEVYDTRDKSMWYVLLGKLAELCRFQFAEKLGCVRSFVKFANLDFSMRCNRKSCRISLRWRNSVWRVKSLSDVIKFFFFRFQGEIFR